MKNKDIICAGLLSAIIILIGIAVCYYVIKTNEMQTDNIGSDGSLNINAPSDATSDENLNLPEDNDDTVNNENVWGSDVGLKEVSSYAEFDALAERSVNTFYVLGREGCQYCELYKPVLETVASEYKIEIVYIDLAKLSNEDYYSLLNSDLKIPGKCSKTGEETQLNQGFGTPLGLFVINGVTYDCIRGYKDQSNLIKALEDAGYIK